MRLMPQLRRLKWRFWYSLLAWISPKGNANFTTMNWGYEDGSFAVDGDERFALQLYHKLTDGVPIQGGKLGEIGCGRGGGIAYLHGARQPASAVGVDLTPSNLEIARRSFGDRPGLDFRPGHAEAMPFADGELDALMTVESSHCYPDEAAFLAEAARVIRPGGYLLWTDFRRREELPALRERLQARFTIEEELDITEGVIRSSMADRARRQALIRAHGPRLIQGLLLNFAAATDESETLQRFTGGGWEYFIFRAKRP